MFIFKKLLFILLFGVLNSVYSQLTVNVSITPINCTNNTATISIMASGGIPDYLYSIDGGVSFVANSVFTVVPGTYTIVVRDSVNNTQEQIYTINQPMPISAMTIIRAISCFGDNDGVITVNAFGGVAPHTYSLMGPIVTGPQASNVFTGLSAGTYVIQVTDIQGCNTNMVATIVTPTALVSTATVTSNDTITIIASGGTPNYQYSIDGIIFVASNVFSGLQPGTYVTYVRDINGCIHSSAVILKPSSPIISNPNQTFPQGATLADIPVTGQNIKWYAPTIR